MKVLPGESCTTSYAFAGECGETAAGPALCGTRGSDSGPISTCASIVFAKTGEFCGLTATSFVQCDEGSICRGARCERQVNIGEACAPSPSFDDVCKTGSVCDGKTNTCTPATPVGATCSSSLECEGGNCTGGRCLIFSSFVDESVCVH